jgi:hypothetical protein
MSEFTEEETKTLKEAAQNLQSASRVGRIIQTALIWGAGVIGSWLVLWEFFLKNIGKA